VKRYIALLMAALMLLLCGCSLLDREYSSVEPHANRYWEDPSGDILRAESYQDLVNILLMLVESHESKGVLRLYLTDVDYSIALDMMKRAVTEVREETAIGSYVLSSMNFNMEELRNSYYQVEVSPYYRRTAEDVAAVRETASSSAIYDLVVKAWEEKETVLAVRYSHLAEEPAELLANIRLLQVELQEIPLEPEGGTEGEAGAEGEPLPEEPTEPEAPPEESVSPEGEIPEETEAPEEEAAVDEMLVFPEGYTPWEVNFYPPNSNSSIVEIFFQNQ